MDVVTLLQIVGIAFVVSAASAVVTRPTRRKHTPRSSASPRLKAVPQCPRRAVAVTPAPEPLACQAAGQTTIVGRDVAERDEPEEVFDPGNPYPAAFRNARLGTDLRSLQSLYPAGKLNGAASMLVVDTDRGLFKRVVFHLDNSGRERVAKHISFRFRDHAAGQDVRRQAVFSLWTDGVEPPAPGELLVWPDVRGCRVTIDTSEYSLHEPKQEGRDLRLLAEIQQSAW
jgi:hypothetical protein